VIEDAQQKRNKLVHGERIFSANDCKKLTEDILGIHHDLRRIFSSEFNFDGWGRLPVRRKSALIWND
jgi:hypothetical protein